MRTALGNILLAVVSLVCAGCPGTGARGDRQAFAPAELKPHAPAAAVARTMYVRVWADQEYRQVPSWRTEIDRAFAGANEFLTRAFAIELVIEVKPWNRDQPAADNPGGLVRQLQVHDPGDDVDWVVGFSGALLRFPSYECVAGVAEVLSKHFVIRADSEFDARYAEYLARSLSHRREDQREALIRSLREHLRVAVLLHEWGHTLGAIHDLEPGQIMYPEYSVDLADFSSMNRTIIQIAMRIRASEGAERAELARALAGDLESTPWPSVDTLDRQKLIEELRRLAQTDDGGGAAKARGPEVTP